MLCVVVDEQNMDMILFQGENLVSPGGLRGGCGDGDSK